MIYFIQEKRLNGRIKIGYSKRRAHERLKGNQTGNSNKLVMLGSAEGSASEERGIHYRLKKFKTHGEWFEPSPEVVQEIHKYLGTGVSFVHECVEDMPEKAYKGSVDTRLKSYRRHKRSQRRKNYMAQQKQTGESLATYSEKLLTIAQLVRFASALLTIVLLLGVYYFSVLSVLLAVVIVISAVLSVLATLLINMVGMDKRTITKRMQWIEGA